MKYIEKAPDPLTFVVGSPVVECLTRRVFDDDTLVKTARHVARRKVHLANVDAVIAALVEVMHPVAMCAPGVKRVYACVVWIHTGKHGRTRCNACSPRTVGVAKGKTFGGESIHRWRHHVIVTPSTDGIKALLVGHDKDDVGLRNRNSTNLFEVINFVARKTSVGQGTHI